MHKETELRRCDELSKSSGANVWLKMETQQVTGSFKYRGISLLCKKSVEEGYKKFVCSSGGNAGLAATRAAAELATPIFVYVPTTTREVMRDILRKGGADVHVHGKVWDETNALAIQTAKEEGAFMIHPFDHPTIWEGHSSLITEIKSQLPPDSSPPDLIIASVGGGGLMNGTLLGMERVGWGNVPFVAMETQGADSLNACVKAGNWVTLDEITSVAKCLGALRVCKRSYEWLQNDNVISCVVPDKEALKACVHMSDFHNVLVPPACGAAVAAVTDVSVIPRLQEEGRLPKSLKNIIVIVCGGSGITTDNIEQWRREAVEEGGELSLLTQFQKAVHLVSEHKEPNNFFIMGSWSALNKTVFSDNW